jgi:hypothetical protein
LGPFAPFFLPFVHSLGFPETGVLFAEGVDFAVVEAKRIILTMRNTYFKLVLCVA